MRLRSLQILRAARQLRKALDRVGPDRSGATALTLIPRPAHSTARCLVRPVATNLAGPYVAWRVCPAMPEIEDRQTMAPPPFISIGSIAYLHVKNMPRPSMDMTSSQSAGGPPPRRQRNDACVRDGDVQPPVPLDRSFDHPAGILRLRHVRSHDDDVVCDIRKRFAQSRQTIDVDVREDKTRPFAGKKLRCRAAYPGRRPRYDRALAEQTTGTRVSGRRHRCPPIRLHSTKRSHAQLTTNKENALVRVRS